MSGNQKTKEQMIQELTEENARKPFEEFPKCLYHPDGRVATVNSSREQTEIGGEWLASPTEALAEAAKRDKRDSDAFIAKVGAEAAAQGKKK